jgi:hypothetical protein
VIPVVVLLGIATDERLVQTSLVGGDRHGRVVVATVLIVTHGLYQELRYRSVTRSIAANTTDTVSP